MMKLITIFLSFILLLSCCEDDTEHILQQTESLKLSVSAGDFVMNGTPGTRIADNGSAITFEEGDRIGVIVLVNNVAVANNLPYVYDGTNWSFDEETVNTETTGKSIYYYDYTLTNVSYIVYYPYSTDVDGVTTIDGTEGLKSKFPVKENQRLEADYRASDLMVWTSDNKGVPLKILNVELKHVHSSVSIHPDVQYTLDDGNSTVIKTKSHISDVSFIIGDKRYYPYSAEDGSYRYILPNNFAGGEVHSFYTYTDETNSTTYKKVLNIPNSPAANTRYAYAQTIEGGTYTTALMQKGDFYCMTSTGKGFLVPKEMGEKVREFNCIGIVFKVGVGEADKVADYENKLNSIHGYVGALKDADTRSGAWGVVEEVKGIAVSMYVNCLPQYDGYKNTKIIRGLEAYKNVNIDVAWANHYWAFKVASDYKPIENSAFPAAPTASSGWYLPSIQQLTDFIECEGLSELLVVAGGNKFIETRNNSRYWSSSPLHNTDVWYYQINGSNPNTGTNAPDYNIFGYVQGQSNSAKYVASDQHWIRPCYVRTILTF